MRVTFIPSVLLCSIAIQLCQCSKPTPQFTELAAAEAGIDFRNDIVETEHNNILTYEYTYNGAGVTVGDVNNDGLADIYFSGNSAPNKLYLNKGNWKFEDITTASQTQGKDGWKTGVSMVDINGDGWLDIYVCYSGNAPGEGYNLPVVKEYAGRSNQLFVNNGGKPGEAPTFTERSKEYGLDAIGTFSSQAYFLDYDRDGDLDMFLVNHANMFYSAFFNTKRLRNLRHPYFGNRLYKNNNDHFEDVSQTAGFHGSGLNFGLSASITDFNFDGWPDIYVTNDYEEQDFCYVNNRDGTFKEVSHTLFAHLSKFGMGSDVADVNNDGLPDLIVLDMLPEDNHRQKLLKGPDEYDRYTLAVDSGYHHQYMRNTLHINRGFQTDSLPRFSEIGQMSGISNTDWSWTSLFVDLDNDGKKDVFITNGFLRDFTNMDFMKYIGSKYKESKNVNHLELAKELPETKLSNYIFKNDGGLQFRNVSAAWGLSHKAVSNGAAYADFDNDGDYDLVTNNLNDGVTLLRNNTNEIQKNNYLKIKLTGDKRNIQALGAKIYITTDSLHIFQEAYFNRGYISGVEPVITVGLGHATSIKEVKVVWPDGRISTQANVSPNQLLQLKYEQASAATGEILAAAPNETLLNDVTASSGLDFIHQENNFIDFKMQRLLYYQLSRLGGKLAVADVNNDGNDDIFFGGASGQSGQLFFGKDNGTFSIAASQPWTKDAACEDMESAFFDADGDGDKDLYVVSGGSEFVPGAPLYKDRLYLNDGKGNFIKDDKALPDETTSGSCVAVADFDKDGDMDIFVGGRHAPTSYGVIPRSYLLRNDSKDGVLRFTEVAESVDAALASPGMVTDAVWTDYNNDTWPDLVVVGEWMPIRIFENKQGKLIERKDLKALDKSDGWWCAVKTDDVDGDGDQDIILGNAGTNMQFKATPDQPVQLYAGDFNKDGALDPIVCYYIQGKSYPLASRDELLDQMAPLRKKFIKYADYADATIQNITDEESLAKAYKFNAYQLSSGWLENKEGKDFVWHALPSAAQVSSVNGGICYDLTGDDKKELLLAGNFYPYKAQLGRSDASMGVMLQWVNGTLQDSENQRTPVWLTGDIRDMAIVHFKSGEPRLVVSRNNEKPGLYTINKVSANQ